RLRIRPVHEGFLILVDKDWVAMRRIFALVAVAGIAAAGASVAGPPSGLIVFSSGSGAAGKDQVWVMNANGTGRHAVTPATFDARAPAASADGRQVAYVRLGQ